MVFRHLTVIGVTHDYIIMVIRAALNSLIISNTKSIITGAGRYLVIKRTSFTFKKKVCNN